MVKECVCEALEIEDINSKMFIARLCITLEKKGVDLGYSIQITEKIAELKVVLLHVYTVVIVSLHFFFHYFSPH